MITIKGVQRGDKTFTAQGDPLKDICPRIIHIPIYYRVKRIVISSCNPRKTFPGGVSIHTWLYVYYTVIMCTVSKGIFVFPIVFYFCNYYNVADLTEFSEHF